MNRPENNVKGKRLAKSDGDCSQSHIGEFSSVARNFAYVGFNDFCEHERENIVKKRLVAVHYLLLALFSCVSSRPFPLILLSGENGGGKCWDPYKKLSLYSTRHDSTDCVQLKAVLALFNLHNMF
jgi:hypothetical protein